MTNEELAKNAAKDAEMHGFDNSRSFSHLMFNAVCEIAEVKQAYDNKRVGDLAKYNAAKTLKKGTQQAAVDVNVYTQFCKDTIQDEIADAAIFLLQSIVYFDERSIFQIEFLRSGNEYTRIGDFYDIAFNVVTKMTTEIGETGFIDGVLVKLAWMMDIVTEGKETLYDWVVAKMEYNKTRPYKHGVY